MGESDHELMRRIQGGDTNAFEQLAHRWERPVRRLLTQFAGQNGEVDDMSQEVFLQVYSARHRYRPRGEFSTWLYRIALNVARYTHRRRRRQWQSLADDHTVSPAESADQALGRQEIRQRLEEAMSALPARLREVLLLKQFSELTFAQISRVTGLPASTVRLRVRAALDRLRVELKRRGISEQELDP